MGEVRRLIVLNTNLFDRRFWPISVFCELV
jgi:hypothetical protein